MRTALTAGFPVDALSCVGATRAGGVRALKVRIDFPGSTLISWEAKALLAAVFESPNLWSRSEVGPWSSS